MASVAALEFADTLKNWIVDRRTALVDVSGSDEIHTAVLQVLLVSKTVRLIGLPSDPLLRDLLAEKLAHQNSATLAAIAGPPGSDARDGATVSVPVGAMDKSPPSYRVGG